MTDQKTYGFGGKKGVRRVEEPVGGLNETRG